MTTSPSTRTSRTPRPLRRSSCAPPPAPRWRPRSPWCPRPPASAATNADLEKQVITLVNAERRKVGCAGMRTGTALRTAARLHSADMAKYRYFSHTSRDGRSPWDRIRAQKYYCGSAENIAAGQTTAKAVVSAWMKSTGHRKNILNCRTRRWGSASRVAGRTASTGRRTSAPADDRHAPHVGGGASVHVLTS